LVNLHLPQSLSGWLGLVGWRTLNLNLQSVYLCQKEVLKFVYFLGNETQDPRLLILMNFENDREGPFVEGALLYVFD
jgi:hypothetical protein